MVCLMLILQCETPIAHKHVWQCLEQLSVAISFVHVSFLQNPECVITKFQFQNVCISSESESLEWESNSWRQRCGSCQAEWIFGSARWGGFSSIMIGILLVNTEVFLHFRWLCHKYHNEPKRTRAHRNPNPLSPNWMNVNTNKSNDNDLLRVWTWWTF